MKTAVGIVIIGVSWCAMGSANPAKTRGVETKRSLYVQQVERLLKYEQHVQNVADRVAFRTLVDALRQQSNLGCERIPLCQDSTRASGAEMTEIENSLRSSKTDLGRLAVMRMLAQTQCFSVRQISRIVKMITSMEIRADALIRLWNRATDPKRFHILLKLLDTADARDRFMTRLESRKTRNDRNATQDTPRENPTR